jgi:hypothetical protein
MFFLSYQRGPKRGAHSLISPSHLIFPLWSTPLAMSLPLILYCLPRRREARGQGPQPFLPSVNLSGVVIVLVVFDLMSNKPYHASNFLIGLLSS